MNLPARIAIIVLLTIAHASAQRTKYNFNPGWKVSTADSALDASAETYDDATWKTVTLPYAWNEDDAFKKDIASHTTGIAWYRKHFKLPAANNGSKVFLEFEGIRQAGEFYLNGQWIGRHENGVMAFGFDVSEAVRFGDKENVLAIRIDNDWNYREKETNQKYQWEDKNFNANYGGISKNVYLHITGKIYQTLPLFSNLGTTGVYVYADGFDVPKKSAVIHAQSEIKNETSQPQTVLYEVSLKDLQGRLVKTFSGDKTNIAAGETKKIAAAAPVAGLNFWSWGYGYLYTVETILKVNNKPEDVVSTRTGFRKTAFKDGMIYLNDRVIVVHGYAQRTTNEWPAIGGGVPAWMSDYSNKLQVEGNSNLVRWMHVTPWKQDIESCDRVGLMQAMPAGDAEADVQGPRWEQRKHLMRDAIIYNKNNPSIIFYECGNENISDPHMQEMLDIRNLYDPHGGRAIGSREMLNSKVAEYGGEMLYTNKSATKPVWATEYSRDEGLRKYWDEYTPPYHKDGAGPLYNGQNAASYNRNMESHALENVERWLEFWHERPGTGKRVSSGGVNIIFSETNTHHRGAENYRRSGEVDALRIIKQNFYANKIMWDGWVDVEKPGIHIIGHWNYEPTVKKDMYVISSADKVELKVNGKSVGTPVKMNDFVFQFKQVQWQPGTIAATGYDAAGKQVCATQITTAGAPYAIKLMPIISPTGWQATGQDIAMVQAEVVDKNGIRCPTALNLLQFETTGPAVWRGGMAQGPDNYILSKELPVEGGVNRVLVRSTIQPGTVTIKATSDGLQTASITLTSKAFITQNGLAIALPWVGLPLNLQRGPTPATPSFTVKRVQIEVAKVTAGANADSANSSYDDNELTDWHNDGKLNTAWVEYELTKPATISEIAFKFNNFRSRTYFLNMYVDGKKVFADSTQRSLGYCTVQIPQPVKGSKVRIELAQPSIAVNTNTGVEVNGKKLDDGVARNDANARGMLSIIEVELYEKAAGNNLKKQPTATGVSIK